MPLLSRPGLSLWYGRRSRAVLCQLAAGALIVVVAVAIVRTTSTNLERMNMSAGFGFLRQHAGFAIGEALIPYTPADSYLRAVAVGAVNTVFISALACLVATVLGSAVGVLRLVPNRMLRRLSAGYVALFRGTPLLLQMIVWYALLQSLPPVRRALSLSGSVFLSQRGLNLPALTLDGAWPGIEYPVRRAFNFEGGVHLTPEFMAVLIGLALYYTAYTAEIVRGGILAVPASQWEAARSLGLTAWQTLHRVIAPQALRVIVPPLTMEYVGIVKSSSLGILVGYPELFWAVSTTIGQTGHAVEGVAVLMAAYLVPSLGASVAMNALNRRVVAAGVA